MKKLFLALAITLLIPMAAQATYIPVYGGSIVPFTGEPSDEFEQWVPATFYETTIETEPDIWQYVSSTGNAMWFLSGMAQTGEGTMWLFSDYIGVQQDHVYSLENHDVEPGTVPIPAPVLLLGSGLLGLSIFRKRCGSKNFLGIFVGKAI